MWGCFCISGGRATWIQPKSFSLSAKTLMQYKKHRKHYVIKTLKMWLMPWIDRFAIEDKIQLLRALYKRAGRGPLPCREHRRRRAQLSTLPHPQVPHLPSAQPRTVASPQPTQTQATGMWHSSHSEPVCCLPHSPCSSFLFAPEDCSNDRLKKERVGNPLTN